MSKETYLTGEEKEKILDLIKKLLAFRLSNEEILDNLEAKKIKISDRTLRRYKQEIKEESGSTFFEVFKKQVLENGIQDILMYEEMQRQCWKLFSDAASFSEKLRALACLRGSSSDKLKMLRNMPMIRLFFSPCTSNFEWAADKKNQEKNEAENSLQQHKERFKKTMKEADKLSKEVKKLGINPKASFAENLQKQNEKIPAAVKIRRTK